MLLRFLCSVVSCCVVTTLLAIASHCMHTECMLCFLGCVAMYV